MPQWTSGKPSFAFSLAMRMSVDSMSPKPPATQWPLIAATTGFGK